MRSRSSPRPGPRRGVVIDDDQGSILGRQPVDPPLRPTSIDLPRPMAFDYQALDFDLVEPALTRGQGVSNLGSPPTSGLNDYDNGSQSHAFAEVRLSCSR